MSLEIFFIKAEQKCCFLE